MAELNTYPTTGHGFYSNGRETIFVNQHGKAFLIQAPDMRPGADALAVSNYLPVDMVALDIADVQDLVVPEWVYDAQ